MIHALSRYPCSNNLRISILLSICLYPWKIIRIYIQIICSNIISYPYFFFWSIKTLYLHYFYLYLYSGQRLCLLSSQAAANTWAVPSILAHIWITDQSSHVTYTKISGYIRRWPCYFPLTPSTPCPCHRFERIAYVMWCALLLGNELLRIGCIGSSGWTKTWTRWIPHRSVRRANGRNGSSAWRIASTPAEIWGMTRCLCWRNRWTWR